MLELFKMESLATIDGGRIKEAWEAALRRCEMDCKDRPGLEEARKLTLQVELVPVMGEEADCESVSIRFQLKDTQPARKTKVYDMKTTERGLLFNDMSPDDVRQGTLDEPNPRNPKAIVR